MIKRIYHRFFSVLKTIRTIKFLTILQLVVVGILMMWERLHGKKILILYIEELGFIQYILPVVETLKKNKTPISFYIATDYVSFDKKLAPFDVSKNKTFASSLCSWLWMADMFLSASVYGEGPRHAVRINLSHNQPTKIECYPKAPLLNYNVHFLTGPLHRNQYERMFEKHKIQTKTIQMFNIGYPKSDALLQGVYKREHALRALGLDCRNPTILYAPAWDPGASLRSFGEDVIEKLLTLENMNIIVKLHPIIYTPETSPNFEFYTGGIDWTKKLSRFAKYSNFRHVTKYSIDPLLAASAVMITDISGVALEFIVLDRPVIYLDCPEYFEKTLRMPGWNTDPEYARNDPRANAGRHVGLVIKELTQLPDVVQRSFDNPDEFSQKRRALREQLLYNPGKASEAAANVILDLLGL
jgi:CDP-glycerol glycerophosphotransferase (TagB/SpsB family)